MYSFEKHARLDKTTSIYSPHVLILEGIFALHDQRVLDLLDLKIFAEADADLCLSRRCRLRWHELLSCLINLLQCSEMYENVVEIWKAVSSNGSDL